MAKKRTYIIIDSNPDEKQILKDLAKKHKFRSLSSFLIWAAYYYAGKKDEKS